MGNEAIKITIAEDYSENIGMRLVPEEKITYKYHK